jgi:hypothetical protein
MDTYFLNGINYGAQLQNGAAVFGQVQTFSDSTHIYAGAFAENVQGFSRNLAVDSGAAIGNSVTAFNVGDQINTQINNYYGYNLYLNGTGSMTGIRGLNININPQAPGNARDIRGSEVDVNAQCGSYNLAGSYISVNQQANVTGSLHALEVNLGVDSNFTGPAEDRPTAIKVNLYGNTSTDPFQRSVLLGGGDGIVNISSTVTTISNHPFTVDQVNTYGANLRISSDVTGSDVIMNSNQGFLLATNSFTGSVAANLGVNQLGALILGGVTGGATVNKVAPIISLYVSLDPDTAGGTINDLAMFRTPGVGNAGSALTINNLYGIKLFEGFTFIPGIFGTNNWGVWVGTGASDNYFGGSINIGNASQTVTNSSVALEVGSDKAIRFPNMSTGTRGGLTPLPGMMIFNTTSNKMNYYDGTDWVEF